MSELMQRLDNLRALIQTPEFLEGKGLSNEVNIRIFCYDPKQEMAVRYFTETLVTDQNLNCHNDGAVFHRNVGHRSEPELSRDRV